MAGSSGGGDIGGAGKGCSVADLPTGPARGLFAIDEAEDGAVNFFRAGGWNEEVCLAADLCTAFNHAVDCFDEVGLHEEACFVVDSASAVQHIP